RGRTQVKRVFDEVTSCNPIVAWAHDYPDSGLPQRSITTVYQSLPKVLKGKSPEISLAVNLELIKILAKLCDKGEFPRKRSGTRGKNKPLMIGEVGIVDGSLVVAPVQQ